MLGFDGSDHLKGLEPVEGYQAGTRQRTGKPRLVPVVAVIGGMVVLFLALALLLIGKSLSGIVNLATDTRHRHLPEVLERQRTAINVERLGRFGEIILSTDDPARRRSTRLAAQILAQDSAFENDPQVHGMAWDAFGSIREIAAMRDRQAGEREAVAARVDQSSGLIETLKALRRSTSPESAREMLAVTSLLGIAQEIRHLLQRAAGADTVEELALIKDDFTRQQAAFKAGASLPAAGTLQSMSRELEAAVDGLGAVFPAMATVLEQETRCRVLWQETLAVLQELTDMLSVDAAATASDRMTDIESAALGVKNAGYVVIVFFMLLLVVLVILFRQHIVAPVIHASRGLERVRSGTSPVSIPEARIMELDAIGETVERFDKALSQIKEANVRLHRLSMQDGLTGIANRRYFDEAFEQEWKRALRHRRALSVLLIDIDHFKEYNDTYGHLKGDDCLKQVAGAIQGSSGRAGDIVARYGGEEFVMALPETDREGAANMAARIQQEIAALRISHPGSVTPWLTVSIGAATMIPRQEGSREELLGAADTALLQAKRDGRNAVRFSG